MNQTPRLLLTVLLTLAFASGRAPAQRAVVPRVTLVSSLGGTAGVAGLVSGTFGGSAELSFSPLLPLTPTLSIISASVMQTPAAVIAVSPSPVSHHESSDGRLFDGTREFADAPAMPSGQDVDILETERPKFSAQQVRRVQETDFVLSEAVREAVGVVLGKQAPAEAISRGSTSRRTYISPDPDYDISVELPASWSAVEFTEFLDGHSDEFKAALSRSASRAGARLFPGQAVNVSVDGPISLSDAETRRPSERIALFHLNVYAGESGEYVKADVTLTNSPSYLNPYPQYFDAQVKQIAARGGGAAVERVLDDIRLAKKFFKKAIGAYKFYQGGPSAVGIEQMVMQSGKVSDDDRGRTVSETGSFDRMMARIYDAAYDHNGALRTFKDFQMAWTVHNAFMRPANFLSLMEPSWKRVVAAATAYREAKRAGRTITFNDLGAHHSRGADARGPAGPAQKIVAAPVPGALTLGMLERFATRGPRPMERGVEYLYAQGAKPLPPGLEAAWAARARQLLPTGPGIKTVRILLLRRQGRTYVMMPEIGKEGQEIMRPMDVDDALAQGIVSDTLVEMSYDGSGPRGLRPIGAYMQDMMIGRVVRRGEEFLLEGLFHENGRTSSLYAPLKLKDGIKVEDGKIMQAFVRPTISGYEAVPMIDLGKAVTPEIAAREIALRRGARGYFDEAVVRQAEAAGLAEDPSGDYARIKKNLERGGGGRVEDLRSLPFVTIDPPGAGDLDDAYHIEKHADGSYTWLLATADVAHYVHPGTPAFLAAARIGNTFYSIDKDGVGEYPMNHPVVSKHLASLLDGKDSLAMITRMRFDAGGNFLLDQSEVYLGLVHVKGRYTYDQVAELWKGETGHGVQHVEQVSLARELSDKLTRLDGKRGKMHLTLDQVEHVKRDGVWSKRKAVENPLLSESHHLIEELKVYGNRVIAERLTRISRAGGIPHISRVHPEQKEAATLRLKRDLRDIGAPWNEGTLSEYLDNLQGLKDLSSEKKQVAQWLVLTSRRSASYAADDAEGHEGLALKAGAYDHPSAPIRRFSDMYNRALLEASLEGTDPKDIHAAVLKDLKSLGFTSLEDYLKHLNGREQATRQMDYEMDAFMSLVELGKPENAGKTFRGYVRLARQGRNPSATIQLVGSAATIVLNGREAMGYKPLDQVDVTIRGADLTARRLDALITKPERRESRRDPRRR